MRSSPVRVVLRIRQTDSLANSIRVDSEGKTLTLSHHNTRPTDEKDHSIVFTCDDVLVNASQQKVFDTVGQSSSEGVLQGYNETILCYGQTGAGKSFTMIGANNSYPHRGIAPRCLSYIFQQANNLPEFEFTFRFSCLEIYNDALYDLSGGAGPHAERTELAVVERGGNVFVRGLAAPEVESEEAVLQLLFEAEANRAIAHHQLNPHSSRSHALYTLEVDKRSKVTNSST